MTYNKIKAILLRNSFFSNKNKEKGVINLATLRVVTEENQIVEIPLFPYKEVFSESGTINSVDVINKARINDARITRSDEHDLETTNIASVYSLSNSTNAFI